MDLSSNEIHIQAKDEVIFQMLTNCNNFHQYVPEISNWTSTEDSCSFSIQGVGNVAMDIVEKKSFSSIGYNIKNEQIKSLMISFHIKENVDGSLFYGQSTVEVPFFVAQMIKPSLQKFLDMLVERIKTAVESKTCS